MFTSMTTDSFGRYQRLLVIFTQTNKCNYFLEKIISTGGEGLNGKILAPIIVLKCGPQILEYLGSDENKSWLGRPDKMIRKM